MTTAKGGQYVHVEDIPVAALKGLGGALRVVYNRHLCYQHRSLLNCNMDTLLGHVF